MMEIPNVDKYLKEKELSIDFLNERLKVSFTVEQNVADNLPIIDNSVFDKKLEAREEIYRAFLGEFTVEKDDSVTVHLTGILEIPDDEETKGHYYNESSLAVAVNLKNIKTLIDSLKNKDEFKDTILIGDIHTHPVKESELKNSLSPLMPSNDDILSIIESYKDGTLSMDRPFIFAIAANIDNKMQYAFYRLIKKNDKYYYQSLNV